MSDTTPEARPNGRPRALTNEQVKSLRVSASEGAGQQSLASAYGISVSLVSAICRGTRYPDAPGPIVYRTNPPKENRP